MEKLLDNAKIFEQSGIVLASTGTTNFTSCDVGDCDGFAVLARLGTITATSVVTLKIQECATTDGTFTDVTGATTTVADSDDDLVSAVEAHRPLLAERFARGVLVVATANCELDGAVGLGLYPEKKPVTQDTTNHVGTVTTKP
jgi:hypothetical protein